MTTLTEYKKEHKEDFGREKIDVLYEDENLFKAGEVQTYTE